jgi:predicted nucleotidyltransferase
MNEASEDHRAQLLDALRRCVLAARQIAGVRRIALLGSIVTAKQNPKDIDVLVVVADDADLTPVARCARRLQGQAQGLNRGADVFLADEQGAYIGRTCTPEAPLVRRCRQAGTQTGSTSNQEIGAAQGERNGKDLLYRC